MQLDFVGQIQDETCPVADNVRDFIPAKLDKDAAGRLSKRSFRSDAGLHTGAGAGTA
jgi:hypothetical protein